MVDSERDIHRAQRAALLRHLMHDDVAKIAANQLEPLEVRSRELLEYFDEYFGRDVDKRLNHRS